MEPWFIKLAKITKLAAPIATGSVSGRVSGGQIQARIDGAGFSASLVVSTRGDRQSVTIEAPGHEVTEVSVALTRAR